MLSLIHMSVDHILHKHEHRSRRRQTEADERNVEGLIALVTGSNSGLGKQTALELAQRGATVIMACRDLEKAEEAKKDILAQVPTADLIVMQVDVGDLQSVRDFASKLRKERSHIDILVNNAGVSHGFRAETKDGFESNIGINHLGPFLLTLLIIDLVAKAESGRIICVSSSMTYLARLNTDDLMLANSSLGFLNYVPYANSKMANGLFIRELAKRLEGCGTNIKAYALCPGMVTTNVFRHDNWYKKIMTGVSLATTGFSVKEGVQTILHCALSKSLENESGKFYRFNGRWDGAPVNKLDNVDKLAAELWEKSEDYVGLPGFAKTSAVFQKKSS